MTRAFVEKGTFKVYILQCCDGSYYTGHTHDLEARLKLHKAGKGSKCVRARLPFELVYTKSFRTFKTAYAEECRIKKLSRQEKVLLVDNFQKNED